MFSLSKPSDDGVRRFLSSQKDLPFTYREVGATREGSSPRGYVVDRYRIKLGEGSEAYERAKEALREWRQFDLGWVRLLPPEAPVEVGTTVGVLARHYGFWSLNAARVVYLIEESDEEAERFGFGYGRSPGTVSAVRSGSRSSGAATAAPFTTMYRPSLDRNTLWPGLATRSLARCRDVSPGDSKEVMVRAASL